MSNTRGRYIHYWFNYCQAKQGNTTALTKEYSQIARAWQLLTGAEKIGITELDREQLVLDYLLCVDDFLEKQGLLKENILWIVRGIEAAKALEKNDLLGRFGQDIGWCYRNLGQLQQSLEYLHLALDIRQKFGPPIGEAATLNMLGVVLDNMGRYEEAITHLEKALILRRETSHKEGEAITLHNLAATYFNVGDWGQAEKYYLESLTLALELEDDRTRAGALNNLGELWMAQNKLEKAKSALYEAKVLYEQIGDMVNLSVVYNNLGVLAKDEGKSEEAIVLLNQAIKYEHQFGLDTALTLNNLGTVYDGLGDLDRALIYFEKSWQQHENNQNIGAGATSLANIGGVHLRQGNWDQALVCYETARETLVQLGKKHQLATILNNLGIIYFQTDQVDKAIAALEEAITLCHSLQDTLGADQAQRNLAVIRQANESQKLRITTEEPNPKRNPK